MVRNLAVVGSPIEHSLSPKIHQAAYDHLGLDWRYSRYEIPAGGLGAALERMDDSFLGLSVTMPLKREAFDLAQIHDQDAALSGSANTLVRTGATWRALNTDIEGLKRALIGNLLEAPKSVLILGSGSTAKSALLAASRAFPAAKLSLAARSSSAISEIRSWAMNLGMDFESRSFDSAADELSELTISTIPSSAQRSVIETHKLEVKALGTLFDVSYAPWPSLFAAEFARIDSGVISGLEMLINQAVLQIEAFMEAADLDVRLDTAELLAIMRTAATQA